MTWWPRSYTEHLVSRVCQSIGPLKVICPASEWRSAYVKGLKCKLNRIQSITSREFLVGKKSVRALSLLFPSMSPVTDHELCGSVGGPGVCAGQRAVQGTQPCNPVWMYRCHRGAAARWLPAVLPLPRPLRQDGRAAVPWESGEIIGCPLPRAFTPWLVFSSACTTWFCEQVIWELLLRRAFWQQQKSKGRKSSKEIMTPGLIICGQ